MEEAELRDLGILRIPIPIPFPQAGGPVNAYVVEEEGGLLLFDAGLGIPKSQAALAEGLTQAGYRFQDLNRIVLSHGHIDHFGAAAWILEQVGRSIPVSIHDADAGKVLKSGVPWHLRLAQNGRYLAKLGAPDDMIAEMGMAVGKSLGMGRQLDRVDPLRPGDGFRCKHVTLEVHHMPGHTPGLCCLYEPKHGILLASDHLLERVSPNPLIEVGPDGEPSAYRPLVSYFQSVDRVRSMSIALVLPGHSTPFADYQKVIDSLKAFYDRRQAKIRAALEGGPLTVFEVMKRLFPATSGRELFLMMSETLANLELLEYRGEVRREQDDRVVRFGR